MTEFSNRQILPPVCWEEFESLCCDLWTELLNDLSTSKNGRSGQAQNGVDIFGRKNGRGNWVGIQCKGKDGRYGKEVTEAELRGEVDKAKSFTPKISEFILLTTAENDAKIQKVAREITEENRKDRLFSVTVFGWSEIVRKLGKYEDIIEKYYPNQSLRLKSLGRNVDELLDASLRQDSQSIETQRGVSEILSILKSMQSPMTVGDGHSRTEEYSLEKVYNEEIDGYRDALRSGRSKTAKSLLLKLKDRCWGDASNYIKFRIITNIAASEMRLGNDAAAVKGFRSAYEYAEDNEIANANLILADIIEKDFSSAHRKAVLALEKFPQSEAVFSYFVSTHPVDNQSFDPEQHIPEELSESSAVAYSVYEYYRACSNFLDARKWIKKAYELNSESFEISFAYSSNLLEPLALDQSIMIGGQATSPLFE